jgi:E3 ubiquitin-protein ligase RNF146
MCRQNIPLDYLENPVLVHETADENEPSKPDNAYHWYYEGRNGEKKKVWIFLFYLLISHIVGFWQYDLRTSTELEEAFNKKEKICTILVAGYLYVVDFEKMYQIRQSDTSK